MIFDSPGIRLPRTTGNIAGDLSRSLCLWRRPATAKADETLRVMTYNIWVGGTQYEPISRTVGVIQAAQADVVGLQEQGSSGPGDRRRAGVSLPRSGRQHGRLSAGTRSLKVWARA